MYWSEEQLLQNFDQKTLIDQPIDIIRQMSNAVSTVFQNASIETKENLKSHACNIWNLSIRYELRQSKEESLRSAELKQLSLSLFIVCESESLPDKAHTFLIASKTANGFHYSFFIIFVSLLFKLLAFLIVNSLESASNVLRIATTYRERCQQFSNFLSSDTFSEAEFISQLVAMKLADIQGNQTLRNEISMKLSNSSDLAQQEEHLLLLSESFYLFASTEQRNEHFADAQNWLVKSRELLNKDINSSSFELQRLKIDRFHYYLLYSSYLHNYLRFLDFSFVYISKAETL